MDEFRMQETNAPFNMAISTLEALRRILGHIEQLSLTFLPEEKKQEMKIRLVKRFYVDASPLLSETIVKKYSKILKIKPVEVQILDRGKKTHRKRIIYSHDLDMELDQYLIELQVELQKEKYYMPPKKNLGTVVGSFSSS